MRIPLLIFRVRDEHLRLHATDDLDELSERFVVIGVGKGFGMSVLFGVRHAAVAVTQPDDFAVTDDVGRRLQLCSAYLLEVGLDLFTVHGRIQNVAGFTAGTTHERGLNSFRGIARDGPCTLRTLVIGVGVDRQDRQPFRHRRDATNGRDQPQTSAEFGVRIDSRRFEERLDTPWRWNHRKVRSN